MLRRFFDRLRLPFRKDRELRSALFRILGFYPHNIDYYKIAFAHKSQAFRDKNGKPLNNERLEFLGDAVLESVISDILFHHFEKRHEGFLTATRSKIVQRESLNRLAKEMGIDKLIQTATRNTSPHSHLGGNAFEALMGAIYLDKGYKTCQKFVQKQILGRLMDLDGVANKEVNFKSKLLEWCQKNKLKQDFIMHLEDNDKQQEPLFHCTVVIESLEFGYGKGHSKKEAQQQAARETLTMLRRDENVVDSVFRSKEKRTAMEANEMAVLPKIDEIEDDLLREQQQQLKRQQPAEPQKAERKEQTPKSQAPAKPKEKVEAQPKKETPKGEQSKEQKPKQKAQQEKVVTETTAAPTPTAKKAQPEEKKPAPAQTPKKEKKANPVNVAILAEAAIAEAETKEPLLPAVVAPHSTAVVPIEPAHKREMVLVEDYKTKQQKQKQKELQRQQQQPELQNKAEELQQQAQPSSLMPDAAPVPETVDAVPEVTPKTEDAPQAVPQPTNTSEPTVAPAQPSTEVPAPEVDTDATQDEVTNEKAPKKAKRPSHKVTRIAEFTKTEVKSEEEVEAERLRIKEEREEKLRNKRIQREANRAKEELEKLSRPKDAPAENDILAEVTLESEDDVAEYPISEKAPLSSSAKRRLRRKRAAERAKLEATVAVGEPANSQEQQVAASNEPATTERKKHQRGNSRTRRRMQAANDNEQQLAEMTDEE